MAGAEYAAHMLEMRIGFPGTVTCAASGRHRHIHDSELCGGEVYSEKEQMLPLPWFLQ